MRTKNDTGGRFWRVTVSPRRAKLDAQGAATLRDVHELGLTNAKKAAFARLYLLEGPLEAETIERIARQLLADPVTERYECRFAGEDLVLLRDGYEAAVEVHLKGGVMDPVAGSTLMALVDMGIDVRNVRVATGRLYRFKGLTSIEQADFVARRLLSNDCIEDVYLTGFGRHDARPNRLPTAPSRAFALRHVPLLDLDDAALTALSREAHLFLSLAEMHAIRDHYRRLDRDPTDLELEMFAQTWSEHCVHKTLKSAIVYEGAPLPEQAGVVQQKSASGAVRITYGNLLADTVARATRELMDSGRAGGCLSVFEDNAGVIAFDEQYGVAFKVETHNHPSAIEPYGGAATGIGGCIRDVLGCGLGARPVANTDIFCFAPPDFPMELLPKGVLHPRRIFKGVVGGVRDYGNRMGIPTVNGAIVFDDRYLGNPLVYCGCIGLIPRDKIAKHPQPGDLIVLIGGRTGRDGIHGATFSSAELTDAHADEFSHAVQIGDPIQEKKVLDAMLRARDHARGCLYTAVTDCGAGGLSSAVGEMGSEIGAEVDLETVPLKYAGLRYDEIWISEAQERMVLAVPQDRWEALKSICDSENVEATVIGRFRDDGRLIVRYDGNIVGDIDTGFLHGGVPKSRRQATWQPPSAATTEPPREPGEPRKKLLHRLSGWNAASKEWVIRQYDHEVQGGSVVKPLVGPGQGPSDGAVIRPRLDSKAGLVITNGLDTRQHDPYWMAVASIDEAVRNLVCLGGNPDRAAILDNFCWGNCQDVEALGGLVRACQGCYDAAVTYGTPFISGKDSLNNEFALDAADADRLAARMKLHDGRIRIPETLLISAISVIDDVQRCVTMDAKPAADDSTFYWVALQADRWEDADINDAAGLHRAVASLIASGAVPAAHDCGEDGVLTALAEMALAGLCGIEAHFEEVDPFAPVPCGYVLQADAGLEERLRALAATMPSLRIAKIGRVSGKPALKWKMPSARAGHIEVPVQKLANAWRAPLNW